ncbi:hypothetical protein RIR_jg17653.t1 [Rhizophagus irregularis DAOM 181602=DAOM 197198]|nr:hypothetical protein RIR_jg17653.t1 [Rhizophagus irregularis DAOM 181602=DAOM 197198]
MIANLNLLLEKKQGMYGKCSKTDLIINSGSDIRRSSIRKKRLKIFSDRKLSNHLDYAVISISRCSHLIKLGY